jgi:hypothetical protein
MKIVRLNKVINIKHVRLIIFIVSTKKQIKKLSFFKFKKMCNLIKVKNGTFYISKLKKKKNFLSL